jgi:hypothetical protein
VAEITEAERVLLVLDRDDLQVRPREAGQVSAVRGGVQARAVPGARIKAAAATRASSSRLSRSKIGFGS